MKVLQINIVYGRGSTGKIAKDLKDIVIKHGDQCYIAYGYYYNDDLDTYKIKRDGKFEIALQLLYTKLTGYHGFTSKRATIRLIRWIKEIRPDVIQLHNIHTGYLNVEYLFHFLKESKIPVVWTLHDCWGFTGHCSYFSSNGCYKWQSQCENCCSKEEFPKRYFFDRSKEQFLKKKELFTGIDRMVLITPSKWLAEMVKQSFLNKYQIEVIPNGIDLEIFHNYDSDFREKYNLINRKIILGVASSWSKRKGLCIFEELSEKLSEEYAVVLVGLNKRQITQISNKIIKIERTNDVTELVQIYSAADVYVNASLEETMGMTTAEAMACGIPAVVFNATAVPEIVDNSTGFVVKKNNVEEIIEGIKFVESSGINYKETCRQKISEFYNKKKQYEKYYDIYTKLMKEEIKK